MQGRAVHGAPGRRAVYTALFGNYESLREQPMAAVGDVPFICFTDDPGLSSDTWEVRVVRPDFPLDSIRSARAIKTVGHESIRDYGETIWVDNRVELRVPATELLDEWLADSDFTLLEHSFRDKLVDEFDAVVRGGYDDPVRVYEQLIHYAETIPDVLDEKPLWTGLIARRWTPAVRSAMREWSNHILRYSRRDQLSVLSALRLSPVRMSALPLENRETRWHAWPKVDGTLGRDRTTRSYRFEEAIRTPLSRLEEVEGRSRDLIRAHELSAERRDATLNSVREELRQAKAEVAAVKSELESQRAASRIQSASEVASVRSALEAEVEAVRTKLTSELVAVRGALKSERAQGEARVKRSEEREQATREALEDLRSELRRVRSSRAYRTAVRAGRLKRRLFHVAVGDA